MIDHLPGFPKKLGKSHYFFLVVLALAFFLRFWNIPNTVQFLGDQGRDALIVSKIFKEGNLVFIGPVMSVGNIYLGPLYYYFMVPFLMLSYPNPLGPVYAIAFLGFLTIYLMYVLGKELVGEKAALIGASLMAVSANIVHGTRFSWNPNPAPLVSLLMIYFVFKAIRKNSKYWIAVISCLSVLIQLHYLTLLSGLSLGILWLWQIIGILRDHQKKERKSFLSNSSFKKMLASTFIGFIIFLLSLSPLILFDLKHDGLNLRAFKKILISEDTFEQNSPDLIGKISEYSRESLNAAKHIIFRISLGEQKASENILLLIAIVVLSLGFKNTKNNDIFYGKVILLVFLITGILGLGLYQHQVYDHYIAYLFPASFLVLGIIGNYLLSQKGNVVKRILFLLIIAFYLFQFGSYNLPKMRKVLSSIGGKMEKIEIGAKSIANRVTENENYDIVLLTGTGDIRGENYRYYLYTTGKPPVEPEKKGEIDTLFIINDDKVLKKVVDSPIYEIVVFPNKNPSEVYQIEDGPEITVLRRNN